MKKAVSVLGSLALVASMVVPAMAYEAFRGPLGVLQNNPGALEGFTLIAPQDSKTTYLLDMKGNVVNEWKSDYVGFIAEMLPNGNMVRHSVLPDIAPEFGGSSGLLEEFDWSGKKVWEHKMFTPGKELSHHTFEVMPNGNYMVLGWEFKSYDEALAKGRDPNKAGSTLFAEGIKVGDEAPIPGIWPDFIREIDHSGKTVWEWHVWDHVGTGPDQFDINFFCPPTLGRKLSGPDWTHFNGVSYNPATDQVCITSRNFGEVFVIDRATGKIVTRWGNPGTHAQGKLPAGYVDDGDQQLFGPHAPEWLANGNISILDNGCNRPSGNYTRAVELDPKTGKIAWFWGPGAVKATGSNFYSAFQCGAQKLPNNNWLITTSPDGHVVEVNQAKEIVWEFINPVAKDVAYSTSNAHGAGGGSLHKAMRYAKDFPGFAGKDMKAKRALQPEGTPDWTQIYGKLPTAPLRPMSK